MTYTPQQRRTGNTLFKWLINQGTPRPIAFAESEGIIKAYPLKKIRSAMTQVSTLESMKKRLAHKHKLQDVWVAPE